jgi:hypothetical protein
MGIDAILIALIWIGVICAVVYLVIWALEKFGLALPPRVVQIAWAIAVLVIILVLWRSFGSSLPAL